MRPWREWIERYVHEVARRLPRRARADVAIELRSLLMEEVEERIGAEPQSSAEEIVLERLKAFGDPAVVARRYAPSPEGLIGSALYPAFRTTVAIVLGVYAALALLWAAASVYTTTYVIPFQFEFTATTTSYDVLMGALANLGVVVVVFAAIERLRRRRESGRSSTEHAWNPRSLPELPVPGRVSVVGHSISAFVSLAILAALHFAPEWLGILIVRGDEWGPFPLLDPNYRTFLPWFDAWLIADAVFEVWLIRRGRKDPLARAFEAAVDGFGALVLLRVVVDGPFTYLDVAFKPVIVIVAVILVISAIAEATRAVREARAARLSDSISGPGSLRAGA